MTDPDVSHDERPLSDVVGFSSDTQDDRIVRVHFNRKVTGGDRRALLAAINTVPAQSVNKPTEDQVMVLLRKHFNERGRAFLTSKTWKDGIDIDHPTFAIMQFAEGVAALSPLSPQDAPAQGQPRDTTTLTPEQHAKFLEICDNPAEPTQALKDLMRSPGPLPPHDSKPPLWRKRVHDEVAALLTQGWSDMLSPAAIKEIADEIADALPSPTPDNGYLSQEVTPEPVSTDLMRDTIKNEWGSVLCYRHPDGGTICHAKKCRCADIARAIQSDFDVRAKR